MAIASSFGAMIEWYDFLIYATAASLVFGKIFFPTDGSPFISSLLAISTVGVGFVVRPIGSIVLSHYGDRLGRKWMLVGTLGSMGLATVMIGVLPTYAQIGIWAPILLVLMRVIQGIAVGGEWGGAVLMATEHAPPHRRGFYGSLVQLGFPVGLAFGTLSFFMLALLPDDQFISWGWRLPFLFSSVLVGFGLYLRLRVPESPEFEKNKNSGNLVKNPVWEAVRNHPKNLLIGLGARITELSWIYVLTIFALDYASNTLGISRNLVLAAITVGALLELLTIPLFGALSDRVGRRPIYIAGSIAAALLSFPVFWAIETKVGWLVIVAFAAGMAIGHGVMYGVQASFLSEMFGSNVRYSGSSLGYQLASPIGGGVIPVAATYVVGVSGGQTWPVATLMIALALMTVVAVYFARETAQNARKNPVRSGSPNLHQDEAAARIEHPSSTIWYPLQHASGEDHNSDSAVSRP